MNNNPKGAKNPKKPLIFYYAVMLLVLMMLNWLLFPSLLQRQVTEVGYDEFISMVDNGSGRDHRLRQAGSRDYLRSEGRQGQNRPLQDRHLPG